MKVSDVFSDLVYGELSSHGLAVDGVVEGADEKRLLTFLNAGLLALYSRYPLLFKELRIRQLSYVTSYKLKVEHAVTNTSDATKYIIDSRISPFTGDVIRVEFVAVGQSYKGASDEIEKILEELYTSGFFDELNQQLPMPLFNIRIEDSLMTSQAEATETAYVHTQTLSFSYGE